MKRGWTEVLFLELVEDTTRLATKIPQVEYKTTGRYPIYDQGGGDVAGYTNDDTTTYRGPIPAILFGDHTRAVKYASEPFVLGADGVKVLTARPGVDARFAYHAIRHVDVPAAGYSRHFKFLKEARFPLPPLDEQRRIAAVLDHVDTLRARRRQSIRQSEWLLETVFEKWFVGERERPFTEMLERIDSGRSPVCLDRPATGDEWSVLKLGAVTYGSYDPEANKAITGTTAPDPGLEVRPGDVLFSRKNTRELVGMSVHVRTTPPRRMLPDLIFRFVPRTPDSFEPAYLARLLRSRPVRRRIQELAGGSAASMVNVSKTKLLALPLPVAPIAEQRAFGQLDEQISTIRSTGERALAEFDALFASLQGRAFAGELDVDNVRLPPA